MMTQAERMATARREFLDAMERGCTISELRAKRAELRRRARQAVAQRTGDIAAPVTTPNFLRFDAHWMLRD